MAKAPRATKAVIPAAGLGTRILPATKAIPKEMLPVVDRPAIQWAFEEASRAGITDVVVVTDGDKPSIPAHFSSAPDLEQALEAKGKTALLEEVRAASALATFHHALQPEALGLGHAVGCAARAIGNEPFAVMLPDDVMAPESTLLADMIDHQAARGASILALLRVPKEDVPLYGCVSFDPALSEGEGSRPGDLVRVTGVVEKPRVEEAPSDLSVIGRYVFMPEIFSAVEATTPGAGGEIQLTDAVEVMIGRGQPVYGLVFDAGRYDTGHVLGLIEATVALALRRPELAVSLREILAAELDR